jgi:hypothetical protein
MAQRDNRHSGRYLGSMQSPDCRRYAPLSGEAKYPAGARPSKCMTEVPDGENDRPKLSKRIGDGTSGLVGEIRPSGESGTALRGHPIQGLEDGKSRKSLHGWDIEAKTWCLCLTADSYTIPA